MITVVADEPAHQMDMIRHAMVTRAMCRILVGRERELSKLEDGLLRACRGDGGVMVLAGDAGMGKSRLCAELASRAQRIGAAVMEGTCSEADLGLPYLPFLQAIGNHIATSDGEDLRRRLGTHARELARIFPQLSAADEATTEQYAPDARLRLFEAILGFLGIASEKGGLLLTLEDLHWADASTRELLDYLTRRVRGRRILVLTTFRWDEMHRQHPLLPTVHGWRRSRLADMIALEALSADGIAEMITSILDNAEAGVEFCDHFHERSEGNPFVLEEMLRAALDRGDVYREDDAWKREPAAEGRLPEGVRDMVLLRVGRLDSAQAEILRYAAVLGRSFDYKTLMDISAQGRPAVEAAIQMATELQLLEEDDGRGHYRFRHALTQEAIYGDLGAPTRERLHSAAADVIAANAKREPGEIAFHLRASNRWPEAVAVTVEAAEAAESRRGYGEAAALYELLLVVVTDGGVERARLLCRMGEALFKASRSVSAAKALEEGIQLLEAASLPAEAAHHRLSLGRCYRERSQLELARLQYETAIRKLEPAGPSADLAFAYVGLAGLRIFDVDGPGGQRLAELAGDIAEAAGNDEMRIRAQILLGIAVAYQGDYPAGIEYLERSVQEALDRGMDDAAGSALANLIAPYLVIGRPHRLLDVATRLESIGVERWSIYSSLYARTVWGHQTGDLKAGMDAARKMLTRAQQVDSPDDRSNARRSLGLCLLELDRLDEARAYLVRPDRNVAVQDATADAWFWLRFHLSADEQVEALMAAQFMLETPNFGFNDDCTESAVEAFVGANQLAEAEKALAGLTEAPSPIARLSESIARARLLLAGGELELASRLAQAGTDGFDRAGLILRTCRARLFVANIHLESDRPEAAVTELHRVLKESRQRGLHLLERQARAGLAKVGISVDEPVPSVMASDSPNRVGERLVTVMFADVRGYTAMSADRSPTEMVDKLSAYYRWAAHEVEQHFGVVDKFAGDAVMATFNASGTHIDHAMHAVQAAVTLCDKARMLDLPIGVGIATGPAVVGVLKVGANLSVIGQTTNLAARLQAQAAAGEVLVSEETYARLGGVHARLEQIALKGFAQPVSAYRLTAQADL